MKNGFTLFVLWLSPLVVFGEGSMSVHEGQHYDYECEATDGVITCEYTDDEGQRYKCEMIDGILECHEYTDEEWQHYKDEGSNYECGIIDGALKCREKHEFDPLTEVMPFAVRINNDVVIVLSAQVTSKSVRGRTALRDRLSRHVRSLFTRFDPGNNEGVFFDFSLITECDPLPSCLENNSNNTSIFFTEMERLGYGKTLITILPRDQLLETFITPELAYSGIIAETDEEGMMIIRDANMGLWGTALLFGNIFRHTLVRSGISLRMVPATLFQLTATLGIMVLIAFHEARLVYYAIENTSYFYNELLSEPLLNKWIVFSDFYHFYLKDFR